MSWSWLPGGYEPGREPPPPPNEDDLYERARQEEVDAEWFRQREIDEREREY